MTDTKKTAVTNTVDKNNATNTVDKNNATNTVTTVNTMLTDTVIKHWIKTHTAMLCVIAIAMIAPVAIRFMFTRTVTKTVTVVEICQFDSSLLGITC